MEASRRAGRQPVAAPIRAGGGHGRACAILSAQQLDACDGRSRVARISRPRGIRARLCREPYRSEEHTSELQSLMRISYAVFCLKKKITLYQQNNPNDISSK